VPYAKKYVPMPISNTIYEQLYIFRKISG